MKKRFSIIFTVIILSVLLTPVFAKEPPSEPVLRPNMEMHSAMINRLDTDGKFIVTASDDKTAKLWDANTGEFIRTFRVPIDEGHEGKIYSCAISPDGNTVAIGGWTGWDWHQKCSIYLFDTNTGRIKGTVDGMGNVINDLEFSKDGRYLSAALGSGGVKIISTTDWKVFKSLEGYGSDSYNTTFDKNGRLATVCFDGYIRLYDSSFNLVKSIKANGGSQPFSIAFSPDGRKLAVGYNDSPKLQVLDGSTLSLLYEPDVSGTDAEKKLEMVLWSDDGSYLFAGGAYSKIIDDAWRFVIRKYSNGGKGSYTDFKACGNMVMDIKSIAGEIVFAGSQPDFGRMDYNGNIKYYKKGEGLTYRNSQFDFFKISYRSVGFKPLGKEEFIFDAEKLELSKGTHTGALYKDKQAGISVTNWEDSYSPELNGKKSGFLKQYEINRSAAITDENTIIWGADWTLYKTDRDGNVLWKIPVPGEVWAVNSIGDIVTAAYDDGTIRWHRLSDGKELMALMINDDMKRWVLYTLEGYYASSPGGEELIGWHINNGKDKEADFFPASRFAERFYRPDILELVLELKDTEKAIETANKTRNIKTTALISESLPPIVNIINPSSGYFSNSETVEITASIRTLTEQPVTETKILLNGRLYEGGERGISIKSKDGAERKYKIKVLQGENTISVLARNNSGWSEASTIRVNYKNTTGEDQDFVIMPKLYILAIGVSDYNDSSLKLRYPSKDANDFAEVMKKQEKKLYREVVIRLLTDQNATKDNILDGLEWIQRETTSKDVAMIFIAGHGMNDSSGDLYYLPQDVRIDKLKRTGLLAEEVINTISSIAGKVIYFMDTCHSGNMKVTGRRGEAVDATKVVMELSSAENGAIVFASSTGRQYSLEDDKWNNGAFTKALVEGLSGKAAITGTERISINMLDLYISERVKDLTGGKQHPTTAKPDMIRDFPIAVK